MYYHRWSSLWDCYSTLHFQHFTVQLKDTLGFYEEWQTADKTVLIPATNINKSNKM